MQETISVADQSDVELLLRLRTGDQTAEQALLARHRTAVEDLPPSPSYDSVEASGRAAVALVRSGRDLDLPFRATWLAVHAHGGISSIPNRDLTIWSAFVALPVAWRVAVWHREVEGQRAREIGGLLGMSEEQATRALASSYAVLKRRVAMSHSAAGLGPECESLVSTYRLSSRSFLASAEIRALREHGRHCDDCLDLIRNLLLIEHTLRDTLAGVVLGDAADGYLAHRPRVARLRVASSSPSFERRRLHPVLAPLSAVAVGAAALTLVFSGPALVPSPAGPGAAQASVPIPGGTLQQGAARARPPAPVGVAVPPGRADRSSSAGSAAGQSGNKDKGGPAGGGPEVPEPPAPEQPGTPPTPTPPPPPPPEPTVVGVEVTNENVTITIRPPVGPDEPVVIEAPVPQVPEVSVTIPVLSDTVVGLGAP